MRSYDNFQSVFPRPVDTDTHLGGGRCRRCPLFPLIPTPYDSNSKQLGVATISISTLAAAASQSLGKHLQATATAAAAAAAAAILYTIFLPLKFGVQKAIVKHLTSINMNI